MMPPLSYVYPDPARRKTLADYQRVRRDARDPHTPPDVLTTLLLTWPEDALQNPALPLIGLADPRLTESAERMRRSLLHPIPNQRVAVYRGQLRWLLERLKENGGQREARLFALVCVERIAHWSTFAEATVDSLLQRAEKLADGRDTRQRPGPLLEAGPGYTVETEAAWALETLNEPERRFVAATTVGHCVKAVELRSGPIAAEREARWQRDTLVAFLERGEGVLREAMDEEGPA